MTKIGPLQYEVGTRGVLPADEGDTAASHDGTNLVLSLSLCIRDTVAYGRPLRLGVGEVKVDFAPPFEDYEFTPEDPPLATYRWYRVIRVQPIAVPVRYKRDFEVQFPLRVWNETTGELLLDQELRVKIIYQRKRYTIWNSPYD